MTDENDEIDGGQKLEAPADFDGPTKNRKCTDVLCSLLFIAALTVMTAVGTRAVVEGDYRVVLYPMDYDGNICGTDYGVIDMTEYKYLYPVNKYAGGVCIKECPTLSSSKPVDIFTLVTYNGLYRSNITTTIDSITTTNSNLTDAVTTNITVADYSNSSNAKTCTPETCYPSPLDPLSSWDSDGVNRGAGFAFYAASTSPYMNRCVLNADAVGFLKDFADSFDGESDDGDGDTFSEKMSRVYSDLYTARAYVLGFGLGVAVAVSFLYSFFLRVPGILVIMVWGSLLSTVALLAYTGYYTYREASAWQTASPQRHTDDEIRVLLYVGYTLWGLAAVLFFTTCALRKRIQLAIGIVKEAARALSAMPVLVFFPVVQCVALVAFVIVWMYYAVHLASLGTLEAVQGSVNGVEVTFRSFAYDRSTEGWGWYFIFCFFWVSQFIVALGQIIVATAVARWFFAREKSTVGNATVLKSLCDGLWFHSGTAAFGSLVIAIISTVRAFLTYVQRKAQKSGNKIAIAVLSCVQCCVWCLEKFMKFVNKNAYVQTAMFGTNFCTSAKAAFLLVLRNAARVGTLAAISEVIVLIGRVFISVVTGAGSYYLLDVFLGDELHSPVGPALFVVVLSFFVGDMFMNIFSMVISTILQCFIADEEMFEGSGGSYSSDTLRTYVDKNGAVSSNGVISP